MLKQWLGLLSVGLLLAGCSSGGFSSSPPLKTHIRTADPVFLGDSEMVLFPLMNDSGYSKFSSDGIGGEWANVFFYDKSTHQSHLLMDRPSRITPFIRQIKGRDGKPLTPTYLLFAIVDLSTQHGGESPTRATLYWSDLKGTKLIQLTPSDTDFSRIVYDPVTSMMYVRVIQDSNLNGHFESTDASKWLLVDPKSPGMGTELWPESLAERAVQLLDQPQ